MSSCKSKLSVLHIRRDVHCQCLLSSNLRSSFGRKNILNLTSAANKTEEKKDDTATDSNNKSQKEKVSDSSPGNTKNFITCHAELSKDFPTEKRIILDNATEKSLTKSNPNLSVVHGELFQAVNARSMKFRGLGSKKQMTRARNMSIA